MRALFLALLATAAHGQKFGIDKFRKHTVEQAYGGRAHTDGKSAYSAPQAIAFALKKASDEAALHGPRPQSWTFQNAFGQPIGREYHTLAKEGENLERRKLLSAAAQTGGGVDKVLGLLKGYGAAPKLEAEAGPAAANSVAAGAGFRLDIKFNYKGRPESKMLKLEDKSESKVLAAFVPKAKFHKASGHNNLVAELKLADEGTLYMTRYDSEVKADDAMSVWRKCKELGDSLNRYDAANFSGVRFPMVSFNAFQLDGTGGVLSQLHGSKGNGSSWELKKFGMQTIFEMDHSGSIPLSEPPLPPGVDPPPPFDVNGGFLVWVKLDNSVVFAAQIVKDAMKAPKRE